MDIIVRKAAIDELDTLLQWRMRVLQEVFQLYENDKNYLAIRRNNETYYRKHLIEGSHTACFAVENSNDRIVGCGGICYQFEMPSPDNVSGTNGYLMNIYTIPEVRGEGIGQKILKFLIDEAKSRDVEKIYLESSDVAKNFYEEIGFVDLKNYMRL